MTRPNSRGIALVLLLALALVRGVMYAAVIPPWQAPDEFRHFEYAKLLGQQRRPLVAQDTSLPVQREIIASMIRHDFWRFGRTALPYDPEKPPQSFEEIIWPADPYWLFQPPLYYAMGALSLTLADPANVDAQLYMVRLLSVLLGVGVVLVAFLTARELFADDDFLVIGIPAFIVFLPGHTFITSAVNNDNLAELLVSLMLLVLVKVYKEGISPLKAASIGLLVVLGLVAKRTTIVTIPLLIVAIPIYFWQGKTQSFKLTPRWVGLTLGGVAVVLAIGLIFREMWQSLWTGIFPILKPYLILLPEADFSGFLGPEGVRLVSDYATGLFESYWARFGWMNVRLDSVWYQLLMLASVAALAGLAVFVIRVLNARVALASWQKKSLVIFGLVAGLAVTIAMLYGIRLWGHFQTFQPEMRPGPQGRYLFVAMIPLATLFMLGLRELVPVRYRRAWLLACLGGLVLVDFVSLAGYIIPYFYGA